MRHHHEDDWSKPLRQRHGGILYGLPDINKKRWDDPPPPVSLGKTWEARAKERSRLELLEQDLASQSRRLDILEQRATSCQLEIHTFAPEAYRVKKPVPIVVRPHNGEFLASFLDANVNASGDTQQEAYEAVKTLLLDMLDQLSRQPRLGPKLASRLAVLREFIDEP